MGHVFSARVHLNPVAPGERCGCWTSVDPRTGKAEAIGFPVGRSPHWFESRWEFDEPMIVRGTVFVARFRLLQAERFDGCFEIGTDFDLLQGGTRGWEVMGRGVVLSVREIEPGESLTWPSKAPAIHPLEPDWTLPTRLRQHGKPLEPALALAHKLECLAQLPFSPKPWFLSDGELALVNGVYLETKGTDP